jgi:hypothetical protein
MATLIRELGALEALHEQFGFTYGELAQALNTSESTVHRWRAQQTEPTPVYMARLEALGAFLRELMSLFKDRNDASRWIREKMPVLKGRSPQELILAGHVDRVTGVLYAINAGIPT